MTLQVAGHRLTILAQGLSERNQYVKQVLVDGKPLPTPFISYNTLITAHELRFIMTDQQG